MKHTFYLIIALAMMLPIMVSCNLAAQEEPGPQKEKAIDLSGTKWGATFNDLSFELAFKDAEKVTGTWTNANNKSSSDDGNYSLTNSTVTFKDLYLSELRTEPSHDMTSFFYDFMTGEVSGKKMKVRIDISVMASGAYSVTPGQYDVNFEKR